TSKDVRVRVLGSKNRLITVRPRSAGTFLMGRCAISCIAAAVSSTSRISSAERSAMPSRCRCFSRVGAGLGFSSAIALLRALDDDVVMAVHLLEPHLHALATRRRHVAADVIRLD